jgi:hypothetical protein
MIRGSARLGATRERRVATSDEEPPDMRIAGTLLLQATWMLSAGGGITRGEQVARDDFDAGSLNGWRAREGRWDVRDGRVVADGGFSSLVREKGQYHDFEIAADVGYSHDEAHAASGLLFRYGDDATGYALGLREIEKGVHPEFGPWERPVLQLFRLDRDGWKLLQESKVMGCRSGLMGHLKVVCRGPNIWVYCEDMATPVLKEFDERYDREGSVGLWKDRRGSGLFDNVSISPIGTPPSRPREPTGRESVGPSTCVPTP